MVRGARAVRWHQSLWFRRSVAGAKSSGEEADKRNSSEYRPSDTYHVWRIVIHFFCSCQDSQTEEKPVFSAAAPLFWSGLHPTASRCSEHGIALSLCARRGAEAINGNCPSTFQTWRRLTASSAQRCGTGHCARRAAEVTNVCATFERSIKGAPYLSAPLGSADAGGLGCTPHLAVHWAHLRRRSLTGGARQPRTRRAAVLPAPRRSIEPIPVTTCAPSVGTATRRAQGVDQAATSQRSDSSAHSSSARTRCRSDRREDRRCHSGIAAL